MPPAARIADPTTHGSPLAPGPGSINVLIGGQPAWRTSIDQHACPAASVSGADGVGSVLVGSPTVYINGQMACRQGDIVVEKPGLALGPANPILICLPTVLIGGPATGVSISGAQVSVTFASMTITGTPEDVATFMQMLSDAVLGSTAGGRRLLTVARDTGHPITLLVGRNQPGVFGDSFASNEVDLSDIEQFARRPDPAHPNETTQDEILVHFITERNHAANQSGDFNPAHQDGVDAQNEMRTERGQSHVTSQAFAGNDADGNGIGRFSYADGTHQDVHIDSNGNIVRMERP